MLFICSQNNQTKYYNIPKLQKNDTIKIITVI